MRNSFANALTTEAAGQQPLLHLSDTFTQTDLTISDKYCRLIHKIENRLLYFREQVDFRAKHPDYITYKKDLAGFEIEAHKHLCKLRAIGNYFNYNKTVDKGENITRKLEALKSDIEHHESLYKQAYDWCKAWPDRKTHLKTLLDISIPEPPLETTPDLKFVIEALKENSYLLASECMKARMKLEMTNAFNMGWYIIFNTVTVDPENYSTVFEKGSDVWRKYINKIKRDVGNTTKNGIKTKLYKNYFNYAAVIEEGESTGRLHIHCLLFLKELIPVKDPNYGLHPPRRREIDEYCDYWEYGHCQFIPIRFSNSDPYGKRGWTWPIDEIGQPIPSSSIEKIASYMTKYILKSVDNKGDASWRTKTSRNMGTLKIKTTLTTLNIKMVMALIRYRKAPESIHLSNIQVPFKIIRTLAVKELVHRLRKKRMPLRGSEKSTILKTLLKHGTQTRLDHNSKNIGNSLLQLFKGTATSKTTYKYFMEAKQMLEDAFPSSTYVEPVSGGNIDNR